MIDGEDRILGGVTIELYRTAKAASSPISRSPRPRAEGLGRRLVAAARAWLDEAGGPDVPMLAETEREEDAETDSGREATRLRQTQLAGLGARMIDYEYWMPPLRPGLPAHVLHLMTFDQGTSKSPPPLSRA